jgi:hypothetical protein
MLTVTTATRGLQVARAGREGERYAGLLAKR